MKGICLMNPTLDLNNGLNYIQQRKNEGFVGIRFNPYLWENNELMSNDNGRKWYEKCGELNLPVGFMCFKGLSLHYNDIKALLDDYPNTKAIIDHWGFFLQNNEIDENAWQQLLSLAQYPQVYVKLSALFRVSKCDWPYEDLDNRLIELSNIFGAHRLMWGTDYPFIQQQCGYTKAVTALSEWKQSSQLSQEQWDFIYRGTVESLFGQWPN